MFSFVYPSQNPEISIMVTGIPNVGKSSLINALRRTHLKKGKASKVGGEPGITRSVLCRIQVSTSFSVLECKLVTYLDILFIGTPIKAGYILKGLYKLDPIHRILSDGNPIDQNSTVSCFLLVPPINRAASRACAD
ncbi:hypothetical protein GDO81_023132 [Engystomops pustulosus]|uniref:G domain-containing protein n=1 Tax=Engystomops pustulosus TaxID=76066 RepID=A0AAV6Z9M6_ENGPU|nr:hypothetical protein GDO81_023132 [Engystomops pustulosus]